MNLSVTAGLSILLIRCSPDRRQDAVVVELGEPRAAISVDESNEFGCIEFLRLTYVPNDVPEGMYLFTLSANGQSTRCEMPIPFECGGRLNCDWPCKQTEVECTGDLKVTVFSRDQCEREPSFELTIVPDELKFEVRRGEEVVRSEVIKPQYRAFAPNGAEPPTCKQAGVDIGGLSTERSARRSLKERAAKPGSATPTSPSGPP